MQAIERVTNHEDWITIIFVISLLILFILKLIKPGKLYGFTVSFFSTGFFMKQTEENNSFFSVFQLLMFGFTALILSLFVFQITPEYLFEKSFQNLLIILALITFYILFRFLTDTIIIRVLDLQEFLTYFLFSKLGYLKTLSIWLFPLLILNQYTFKSNLFLTLLFLILFTFRFFLIIYNNKRLVAKKLFYFILYLCALEIAPLLIVYKTTTT